MSGQPHCQPGEGPRITIGTVTTVGREYDTWYGVASEDLEGLVGRSTEDVFSMAALAVGLETTPDGVPAKGHIYAS